MDMSQTVGMIALFAGLSVFFLLYAIYAPIVEKKVSSSALREGILDDDIETMERYAVPEDGIGKYVRPILNNFLPQLPQIPLSDKRKHSLNNLIIKSGNPWKLTVEELVGIQIAFAVIGTITAIFALATGYIPDNIPPFVLVAVLGLSGYFLPYSQYNGAKNARTKSIEKELPGALDLLNITINSGQVFEQALESVTRHLRDSLLKTEFSKVIVEIQAGSTLERSFTNLSKRFESEDLESFTKAVIQANKLGSDVSETLAHQAEYVRSNYEARLQRMIARLSTTLFLPLIGTMLPAFMLILLVPTMFELSQYQ